MSKRRSRKKHHDKRKTISTRKRLSPKTSNQEEYIRGICESAVTFCCGPAGSGKTAVAVGLACEYLLEHKVEKIIVTRPVVESGRGLGFLPGSLTDKIQPYLVPVVEEMKLYLTPDTYHSYRAMNTIEMCPLEYMRGRNFHNSFMVLDEAQNATYEQIKMFLTRIGKSSKAVINGDIGQTDLRGGVDGGLSSCMDRLEDIDGVTMCELDHSDIVRNGIISKILSRL
tara:strand:+ start:5733 stop:6410 length:678 start_codon:yes stop_codon:yes gene_type:complete